MPNNSVWVRLFETLSSTKATPVGRSVTDCSRLILIIWRQLLSARVRQRWPSRGLSRECIPGRNLSRRRGSCEMGRTSQRGSRSACSENPPCLSALIHHLKPESFALPHSGPRWLHGKNPWSFALQAPEYPIRFRGLARGSPREKSRARSSRVSLFPLLQTSGSSLSAIALCTGNRQPLRRA